MQRLPLFDYQGEKLSQEDCQKTWIERCKSITLKGMMCGPNKRPAGLMQPLACVV